jgi:hypothetical protein
MDCFAEPVIGRRFAPTRWLAMTARCDSAFSPRDAPEVCSLRPSDNRGRRECRTLGASAAACAVVESTRVSHHGHAGNVRHSPRDGFTAYPALSLVTGLSCHHRQRNNFRRLDASVGASGPHGFVVRRTAPSSEAPPASIASNPASVTIAIRPSEGLDSAGCRSDLRRKGMKIFLRGGTGQVASAGSSSGNRTERARRIDPTDRANGCPMTRLRAIRDRDTGRGHNATSLRPMFLLRSIRSRGVRWPQRGAERGDNGLKTQSDHQHARAIPQAGLARPGTHR